MLANIRNNYNLKSLSESDVDKNPIQQASLWLDEAIKNSVYEPTAMNLSTATKEGKPSSRIVLLKEINEKGFVFFTNYESKKGKEIEANPFVALTLFWKELERQIRIEGTIVKINTKDSDDYYNSRPLGSRIGAIVSPQSKIIKDRSDLEKEVEKLGKLPETDIKRPDYWGGYIVIPTYIEFWQGRTDRLHDRICYQLDSDNWVTNRLAP